MSTIQKENFKLKNLDRRVKLARKELNKFLIEQNYFEKPILCNEVIRTINLTYEQEKQVKYYQKKLLKGNITG